MGELGRSVYAAAVTALLFVVPALVARTHFGEFLFTRNAMNKRGRDKYRFVRSVGHTNAGSRVFVVGRSLRPKMRRALS
jgi:hypothetical protein